jgi:8-oxo-dGTP pyrophosphatase MutT (NUDIX family)
MQMYKVFVNDCLIILTENMNISTKLRKVNFEDVFFEEFIQNIFNPKNEGICLICNDLNLNWKQFKSHFKIQKAAGGKVFNHLNEVLFIYRFDKWDLPKGKLEKGETIEQCAIREVEEECGITNLIIENKLETTYHIFERKDKLILKISHWFLMKTNYSGALKPQIEEGISEVVFKNEAETIEALKNSYENIKLLF